MSHVLPYCMILQAEDGFFEMPSDFPSFDDFASGFESMKIRNKRSAMEGQNEVTRLEMTTV